MASPVIASHKGYCLEVKAGRRYLWCSCGRSANQPFCDGSHKGTEFLPVQFVAERDEDVILCGCKHTSDRPFCDGTHSNLPGGYRSDDPDSAENRRVATVMPQDGPKASLDGDCYVFSPERAVLTKRGTIAYCAVISPQSGALFQSQFYIEANRGKSPVIASGGRHTVLFVTEGDGEVEISGRHFAVQSQTGVYIEPEESFRLNVTGNHLRLFVWNGPGAEDLQFLSAMTGNFNTNHPNRIAEIDPAQRKTMAERFYQLLINREHGSEVMTQFIGNIPQSKAEPHRHLYEEVLVVLKGDGLVWTESFKTTIGPGDVLFLPRKQIHSVQCISPGGLDLVGVIYPGNNPSINY
ncbi:MAG TPA: CDGSH iron-sulfur domain-containing protein [Rhizomicrobium sp.]|nr:CDGSH iron-sulfur domain-containing protein [Rhizomicrobium sp.]